MEKRFQITPATAITSDLLTLLCENYHDAICKGERLSCMPRIRIRYVEDRDKFGYAEFGDFFFFADDLYVWRDEEQFADDHSKDVVDNFFEEKCTRMGYAVRFLYAGADTNYGDSNGEHIFVGDVIEIKNGDAVMEFALSHFSYLDTFHDPHYRFMLDNHSLNLEDCVGKTDMKLTRIGTVYFLDDSEKAPARCGYSHVAFSLGSTAAVDALTERLRADGYEVVSGPRTTGDGYYESCLIGIEGNQIEITV